MEEIILQCWDCDSRNIEKVWENVEFHYGLDCEVTLTAFIPVYNCKDCSFGFIDGEGMDLKDKAVKEYLEKSKCLK